MRVFGWWNHGVLNQTVGTVWVKLLLAEFRCVSGSQTGLDSRFVGANEMFCSSMALTTGTVGNGLVQNLENGSPSWAKMDMQGCRKFQVECCNVDGSAFGNALLMETSTP